MSKISIIIPCYNEAQSIGAVLKRIPEGISEIIVVDNNSSDQTGEIARQQGARVVEEKQPGYGAAIQAGFRAASGDILVVLDGDDQYPAEKILEIVNYLETKNLDFISASRFPLRVKKSLPRVRRFGNHLFNLATNFIFGTSLKDSQSGMWIFRRTIFDRIKLESDSMPLSEEIKLRVINEASLKFAEYPIDYRARLAPSKLLPLKHGWLNLLYLLKLKKEFLRTDKRPLWFFLGMIFLTLVFVILASFYIREPFYHVTADVNGDNGIAALNIVNNGAQKMKFGLYTSALVTEPESGHFYTHHPAGFIWPTVWTYKLFGVSELTTRLGPLLFMLLGFWFWAYGLRKIFFPKIGTPLIILGIFSLLPGVIFYGETLELAIFSLPAALISWSLFVAWNQRGEKFYLWCFFISVLLGALIGWFFYLLILAILILVLFSPQIKKRGQILIITPLIALTGVFLNLLHFWWLNGSNWADLIASFNNRVARPEVFKFWWLRIDQMSELHFGSLFLSLAAVGLLIFIIQYFYKRTEEQLYFWPWLLLPFLVFLIFSQWSTHPFGVIFLAPLVAISAGWFISKLIEFINSRTQEKFTSLLILLIIFSAGIGISISKLDFFFNDFQILKPTDLQFIKALPTDLQVRELCLGRNEMGISFGGIIVWNLRQNISYSPACLEEQPQLAIIFNPNFGPFYRTEAQLFLDQGFQPINCFGNLCLLKK